MSTIASKTWWLIKLHPTSEIKARLYCSEYTSLARLTECLKPVRNVSRWKGSLWD